jgi:A/G-specific adenine glycosylase
MPWRKTTNPYYIWLSEIILQQTRVEQGTAYYLRFVKEFPTVFDLAKAKEEQVLKLWQGLGYYSRARNLHFSANYIVHELNGEFPSTYSEIIKLKGVGDYTASAIASICFNEAEAVVDGNVYRVLARYFGVDIPINSGKGIKAFKNLAQELIDPKNAAMHNQAIMEFGARMCKPQNPDCTICPLNGSCVALDKKKIKELPVKINKTKIRNRYFNYLVVRTPNGETILNRRKGAGIWQNLYEFPLIESEKRLEEKEILLHESLEILLPKTAIQIKKLKSSEKAHKLSHQHIFSDFWMVKLDESILNGTHWKDFENFPVPILIHNFVEDLKQTNFFSIFD